MNILIKDVYTPDALALLQTKEDVNLTLSYNLQLNEAELDETDILLIRSRTKLSKEILAKAKKLEFIVTATSGYDHIDLEYCRQNQIKVAHTPDANRDSAAELAIMLMLNCIRHSRDALTSIKENNWRQEVPRGHTLSGKALGIIGLGRVGSRVAELAQGFKMKVTAFDPYQPDEQFQTYHVERSGYTELLKQSDIVSYHVPLTEETRYMLNDRALASISKGTIVINTCRGGVVDEHALYRALVSRKIAAAGLDVFEQEPLPKASDLRTLPNVFMTTHLGAYTYESISAASRQAVQAVCLFLENKEVPCCLV